MYRHFKDITVCGLALAVTLTALTACDSQEPASEGGTPDMRRLTEEQYRNTIANVFGPTIIYGGRFDPLARTDGLNALGARTARVTASGFEQFYAFASSIAGQVVDEAHRDTLVPCKPVSANAADDTCAKQFFTEVGRVLYRRALSEGEVKTLSSAAHEVAATTGDFYQGLAYGLAGMMVTPKFLFVIDTTEPDPDHAGAIRLDAYARASRLSFLLWNTTPDDMLLTAAERGELYTKAGLQRQIDRMIASPRLEGGVQGFVADFLGLQKFETIQKDPEIFPKFNAKTGEDAKEQILRTITDHVARRDLDYRDLFTTRRTFVTTSLARIYKIPTGRPDGGWTAHEFAENDPRAGLLAQIGFLAVNSHPGRSSPTVRGRAIRETLLCQKVPDPPGDVDFSVFTDPNSPRKTAKERLTAHRTAPACVGCHKITDPLGLGLENFDGAGALRTTENGQQIDPSGDFDGKPFQDALGLAQAMHDSPAVASCLVNRLYSYALGRPIERGDKDIVAYFQAAFEKDGYRVRELLRHIAASDAFYKVRPPKSESATQTSSAGDPLSKENPS